MNRFRRPALLAALATACVTTALRAQQAAQPDPPLDAATRRAVIEAVAERVSQNYVFPDTAERLAGAIRSRARRGEYDRITKAGALADSLTAHLQAVSRNKHLRVLDQLGPGAEAGSEPGGFPPALLQAWQLANYGFERVERLPGNVGYLELREFLPPAEFAAPTAAAAMNFLAHTDALIIDLRRLCGGQPDMVTHLASYLFGPDSVLLNTIRWRAGNRTDEFWTVSDLSGQRYGVDKPIYVLTSSRTFSGGEEFAYDLKHLGRATVVGETTAGGANPAPVFGLPSGFSVQVPTGTSVNPVTKTNWEGTGVAPDIAVPAETALKTAQLAALRTLFQRASDPAQRQALQRAIDMVRTTESSTAVR